MLRDGVTRADNQPGAPGPPVRLLKYITSFHVGGTERQVMELLRHLDRKRFDIEMACIRRDGALLNSVTDVPVSEFSIPSFLSGRLLTQQLRFARHLRRRNVDIMHSYGFYANLFAIPAARLARTPVVIASIRDTGDHLTASQRMAQSVVCRLADCVLTNADAVRDKLIAEGYAAGSTLVIRNGVRVPPRATGERISAWRSELGLPAEARVVAVLCRLTRLKGVEYFLRAAAAVAPRFPSARFLVVGDGTWRSELEKLAARLDLRDRVVFAGFRLNAIDWLSYVDISVLPSLSEGLSNTLLESMAAGVPVVATSVGGTPELIEDGVTGILAPPGDWGSLAEAIIRLLSNPEMASALGQRARARVARCFSIESMVRETETLYGRLLLRAKSGIAA